MEIVDQLCRVFPESMDYLIMKFKVLINGANSKSESVVRLSLKIINNFLEYDKTLTKNNFLKVKKMLFHFLESIDGNLKRLSHPLLK